MATTTGRLTARSALVGLLGATGRRRGQERAEARLGLLLAAPAIATIVLIAVIPLEQTIQDSLFQISLKFENAPRPFVGLDNYGAALGDESWFNALRVTGLVAGASVAA
jgi:multiple sugar transport system permease protein